jgi:hypothetical protein
MAIIINETFSTKAKRWYEGDYRSTAETKTVYPNVAANPIISIPEASLLALNSHEPSTRVELVSFDDLSGEIVGKPHAFTKGSPVPLNNTEPTQHPTTEAEDTGLS